MEREFWLERWQRKEIGFHQEEVNSHLREHWAALAAPAGSRVFVPLCGKSLDMHWLREQGYNVLGVELSEVAVREFFIEAGLAPAHDDTGKFKSCEAGGLQLLCGDFFDLTADDLVGVTAVYDRASLVALPPAMRERYAVHLLDILPAGAVILLVTFDYPQHEMPGPPFAVSQQEVAQLYHGRATVELLASHDVLADNPRFAQRGITRLHENIFKLTVT